MMTVRWPSRSLTSAGVPFGLLLALASCATSGAGHFALDLRDSPGEVRVEVSNHSFRDLRVYLERQGVLFPLGRVDRMRTETFGLSEGVLADALRYALVTRPVGEGEESRTDLVPVTPGSLHRWTLLPSSALFHGVERESARQR